MRKNKQASTNSVSHLLFCSSVSRSKNTSLTSSSASPPQSPSLSRFLSKYKEHLFTHHSHLFEGETTSFSSWPPSELPHISILFERLSSFSTSSKTPRLAQPISSDSQTFVSRLKVFIKPSTTDFFDPILVLFEILAKVLSVCTHD